MKFWLTTACAALALSCTACNTSQPVAEESPAPKYPHMSMFSIKATEADLKAKDGDVLNDEYGNEYKIVDELEVPPGVELCDGCGGG